MVLRISKKYIKYQAIMGKSNKYLNLLWRTLVKVFFILITS